MISVWQFVGETMIHLFTTFPLPFEATLDSHFKINLLWILTFNHAARNSFEFNYVMQIKEWFKEAQILIWSKISHLSTDLSYFVFSQQGQLVNMIGQQDQLVNQLTCSVNRTMHRLHFFKWPPVTFQSSHRCPHCLKWEKSSENLFNFKSLWFNCYLHSQRAFTTWTSTLNFKCKFQFLVLTFTTYHIMC